MVRILLIIKTYNGKAMDWPLLTKNQKLMHQILFKGISEYDTDLTKIWEVGYLKLDKMLTERKWLVWARCSKRRTTCREE